MNEPRTAAGRVLDGYAGPAYRHVIIKAENEAREQGRAEAVAFLTRENERLRAALDYIARYDPGREDRWATVAHLQGHADAALPINVSLPAPICPDCGHPWSLHSERARGCDVPQDCKCRNLGAPEPSRRAALEGDKR